MEEESCYKWGHPHVASLIWSHRLWNNSDDQAFYLCQHLVLSTTFWGAKHCFHFTCSNWGLGKWVSQDNTNSGRAKTCMWGFWLQLLTPPHTVWWARPSIRAVEWFEQSPASTPRMKELSSWTPVLLDPRVLFPLLLRPGLWEEYPYSDYSWLSHWRVPASQGRVPRGRWEIWSPIFHQASHGCAALAVHEEPASSRLLSFVGYASSAGSNHITLLQAAYKIKTIAMPWGIVYPQP